MPPGDAAGRPGLVAAGDAGQMGLSTVHAGLRTGPAPAGPAPSTHGGAGRPSRRRRSAVIAVSAAVLVLAGVVAVILTRPGSSAGGPLSTLTLPGAQGSFSEQVAFSPNGKTVAVAPDSTDAAQVWNVTTGHRTQIVAASQSVDAVAFDPRGSTLATAYANGSTFLWDAATGQRIGVLADPRVGPYGHGDTGVTAVAFSPDGTLLATSDSNGTTYLWDLATRQRIAAFTEPGGPPPDSNGQVAYNIGVAFSPDSKTLATIDSGGDIYLWDVASRHEIAALSNPDTGLGGPASYGTAAFSPDGKTLAAASWNGHVYLWDLATRQRIAGLADPRTGKDGVNGVAFTADGKLLAAADSNGHTYLWDVAARRRIATFGDPHSVTGSRSSNGVLGLAFSPDGKLLATSDADGHAYLWQVPASP